MVGLVLVLDDPSSRLSGRTNTDIEVEQFFEYCFYRMNTVFSNTIITK